MNNNNKILLLYKILPISIRDDFKREYGKLIKLSPVRFYQRIKENKFNPHEQAMLSYHLGIAPKILFPSELPVFEIHPQYKKDNEPLYKNFFKGFVYDPLYISNLLLNKEIPIVYNPKIIPKH